MTVVIYDFETTSNRPDTTRVVQTAWINVNTLTGEIREQFNILSNPEVDIHHEAQEIHGISNEMVKGQPIDREIIARLASYLDASDPSLIMAGHNSTTFDLPILERMSGATFRDRPSIDTLVLAQRTWLDAPNHKLSDLVKWLGIDDGEGAHDALADIKMVWKLIQKLCEVHGKTVQELAEWNSVPHVQKICGIGKNKGKPWGRETGCVPWFFVNWMVTNWDSASPDMQATILHHYGKRFKFKGAMRVLPPNVGYL